MTTPGPETKDAAAAKWIARGLWVAVAAAVTGLMYASGIGREEIQMGFTWFFALLDLVSRLVTLGVEG